MRDFIVSILGILIFYGVAMPMYAVISFGVAMIGGLISTISQSEKVSYSIDKIQDELAEYAFDIAIAKAKFYRVFSSKERNKERCEAYAELFDKTDNDDLKKMYCLVYHELAKSCKEE